jgi:hypothetical protein
MERLQTRKKQKKKNKNKKALVGGLLVTGQSIRERPRQWSR